MLLQDEAYAAIQMLLENMRAKLVVVDDDHEEIQKHVPSPTEQTMYYEPREQDYTFGATVGLLKNACEKFAKKLAGMETSLWELGCMSTLIAHTLLSRLLCLAPVSSAL